MARQSFWKHVPGWLCVPLTALFLTSLAFIVLGERHTTRAHFSRIQVGMTREQVEALLGKPFRDSADALPWSEDPEAFMPYASYGRGSRLFDGTEEVIHIWYSVEKPAESTESEAVLKELEWSELPGQRVAHKEFSTEHDGLSSFERLRRELAMLWR